MPYPVFKAKVNILYLVWCGEDARRNIHVRGMEDVRDARFCEVKTVRTRTTGIIHEDERVSFFRSMTWNSNYSSSYRNYIVTAVQCWIMES